MSPDAVDELTQEEIDAEEEEENCETRIGTGPREPQQGPGGDKETPDDQTFVPESQREMTGEGQGQGATGGHEEEQSPGGGVIDGELRFDEGQKGRDEGTRRKGQIPQPPKER